MSFYCKLLFRMPFFRFMEMLYLARPALNYASANDFLTSILLVRQKCERGPALSFGGVKKDRLGLHRH